MGRGFAPAIFTHRSAHAPFSISCATYSNRHVKFILIFLRRCIVPLSYLRDVQSLEIPNAPLVEFASVNGNSVNHSNVMFHFKSSIFSRQSRPIPE